ncbi:hypothetical protein HY641_03170 [Candidatus Woesearchaeota archaeon]|nr:hypothetical protein [Candidatus Woesearchaeota archaeon]
MAKLINVADDVYQELTKRKGTRSYSEVIREMMVPKGNRDAILSFGGKGKRSTGDAQQMASKICLDSDVLIETFELLEELHPLPFDDQSARLAGDVRRSLSKRGLSLDFGDIAVGSICIRNDTPLKTLNKKHFERLTEFGLVLL